MFGQHLALCRGSEMNEIDLRKLWTELDVYEKELATEGEVLEEVWIDIAELRKKNEQEMISLGGIPELVFLSPDTIITLNVGGQEFETTSEVLTRDPYSMLACLCRMNGCPVQCKDPSRRAYYLDRDWWIFRHVLSFLRSDILPSDLDTLKELYREAIYYRLRSLQKAIEDFPVDHVQES